MSLINEALKKAQRDRHLDSLPPMPGGGGRPRRGRGMSTQTILLIGSGVFALFVLSVVGTVLLINRQPAPKVSPLTAATKPATEVVASSSPMIVLPLAKATSSPAAVAPTPTPVAVAPAISLAPLPTPTPVAVVTVSANLLPARPPSSGPDKFDQRIQTMVDSWRVTAVRSQGEDSKLFMNGAVFHVGDVIERASGLRLTKVSATTLTFTDADGVTYVKRY